MPIDYKNYPDNWKTEIRPRILERDNHQCKFCKVKNYATGWRVKDGENQGEFVSCSMDVIDEVIPRDCKPIKIVLTVAHLDHKLELHDDTNLAALCQRCHLEYDRAQNIINRRKNKDTNTGRYTELYRAI